MGKIVPMRRDTREQDYDDDELRSGIAPLAPWERSEFALIAQGLWWRSFVVLPIISAMLALVGSYAFYLCLVIALVFQPSQVQAVIVPLRHAMEAAFFLAVCGVSGLVLGMYNVARHICYSRR